MSTGCGLLTTHSDYKSMDLYPGGLKFCIRIRVGLYSGGPISGWVFIRDFTLTNPSILKKCKENIYHGIAFHETTSSMVFFRNSPKFSEQLFSRAELET